MNRTKLIEAARGSRPLDLAITNVNLVNVFTCEIYPADIGVYGDRIALVAPAGAYALEATRTDRRHGKVGGARLCGHPSAHRKHHGHAGQLCRGRAALWHHHLDHRPPRDRQCAGDGGHPLHGGGQRRLAVAGLHYQCPVACLQCPARRPPGQTLARQKWPRCSPGPASSAWPRSWIIWAS